MFKVQENQDGSTSIFCNKSGALICTVKSQQKSGLGCRPVNVVEPSPQPSSHSFSLGLKSECSSDEYQKLDSRKRHCESPIFNDPKDDFYDDCITPEEFARCLNLVPTKKFKNTHIDHLNSKFPLRHHSRTKALHICKDLHDLKLPDDLPLTSSFGVKLLKLNPQRNFYCDQTISMKIKNYDSFCREQLNTPVCSNFPKLRCREKKEYPVYVSKKFLKNSPSHTYVFNKRQRLEKMLTFKTGLNSRSRKLLQQCTNQKLGIFVKRLTPEEIQCWLSKKSGIIRPITMDCIKDETPITQCSDSETTVVEEISLLSYSSTESSDSSSSSSDSDYSPVNSFKGIMAKSDNYLSPSKSKSRQFTEIIQTNSFKCKDCCVRLNNVLTKVCRYLGAYYIHGTQICIPFLNDAIDPKLLSMNLIIDTELLPYSHHVHAYHLPIQDGFTLKKSLCLNYKSSKNKYNIKEPLKVSNSVPYSYMPKSTKLSKLSMKDPLNCSLMNNAKAIKSKDPPIIDLTDSPPKQNKRVSNWIFKCYGCGLTKIFMNESTLKMSGIEHLRVFHCVNQTDSFLKQNLTTSGVVLEAFPGYKGSFK